MTSPQDSLSAGSQVPWVWDKLDVATARAMRRSITKDWMLDYFKFPEHPEIITYDTHQRIQKACDVTMKVLGIVSDRLMSEGLELDGRSLLDWMDIPNHCIYWLKKFYRPGDSLTWGRPDFHVVGGKPWLLETNYASAAGFQQQVTGLIYYYCDHPQYQMDLFARDDVRAWMPMKLFAEMLSRKIKPGEVILFPDIYEKKRHGDNPDAVPYGGLVSWLNMNSSVRAVSGFVHDVQFDQGVYLKGTRIDHVFMSYYNPHVFDRFDEFLPFWDLHCAGQVGILDSMNEILWSNKLLLGFVSEFVDDLGLPETLVREWKACVPWTRILRPGKSTFEGKQIDLLTFAKYERNRLVLKKAQSAEGNMAFVGNQVPQLEWEETVQLAIQSGTWIIQEFIPPVQSTILLPEDGDFQGFEATQTLSPYLCSSDSNITEVAGYLVRYYQVGLPRHPGNSAHATRMSPISTAVVIGAPKNNRTLI